MTTSRQSILPTPRKTLRQVFATLWSGDPNFRGFVEFALVGAVVLSFLHGLNLNVFRLHGSHAPKVAPSSEAVSQSGNSKALRMPTLSDVMVDESYFANKAEPLHAKLVDALAAVKTKNLAHASAVLAGIDADDPSVSLMRAIVAVASPDPSVYKKGLELLEQSASRGESKAMAILGAISLMGHGGQPANIEAGRQYLQKAADAGDPKAAYVLASGYIAGWAGRVDLAAGAGLLRRAAERGYTEAMFQYAVMLIKGVGVEKNSVEGEIWLLRAAELGHAAAQAEFGTARLIDYLHQVTTDAAPAITWLTRAAGQGDASAMFTLGAFYSQAKPSTGYSDPTRAAALFKTCSEETLDDRCTFAYATILQTGRGTAIDLVRAYAFYRLSDDAKKTPRADERLADLEKQLSAAALKDAREVAQQVREQYLARNMSRVSAQFAPVPTKLSGP